MANVTSVRISDPAETQLAATMDGVEWTGISCRRDGNAIIIDGDGQIPDAVKEWIASGNLPTPYTPPAPTQADYAAAVQMHIDALAVSRGYADGVALAGYVASNIATWAYEAHAFIEWRDAVWDYVYAQLAAVQAGQRQQPTMQGLIGELPSIDWNLRPDDTLSRALDRIAQLESALGEFAQRLDAQP